MQSREFIKPRLTGQRFNDHTIPLQILEDLAAYEEFLHKVAKWVYYDQNDTKRVPKGFGKDVSLKLANIEKGSVIPSIIIASTSFIVGETNMQPYYEQAQLRIIKAIDAAQHDSDATLFLPPELLAEFGKVGKNLKEDEGIDFSPNGGAYHALLTNISRRKLAFSSPAVTEISNRVTVRGAISALDKKTKEYTFTSDDNVAVSVAIDAAYAEVFKEAFDMYDDDKRVLIKGMGIFNKQNRLQGFEDVEYINILHEMDVPTRLKEFLKLQPGWMNGEGTSYAKKDIEWLSQQFDDYYSPELLLPYTYPTIEGGIQFEWIKGDHDATLNLNLQNKSGYFHYLNLADNMDREQNVQLDTTGGWDELNAVLLNYFKI